VGYHEAFWAVTGTAAPVIALAAVVAKAALPDVGTLRTLGWVNMIVQAWLLGSSLSALSTGGNVTPPWVASVLAVGGILLLAWTLQRGDTIRRQLKLQETIEKGKLTGPGQGPGHSEQPS
jgi:hypothetical protein